MARLNDFYKAEVAPALMTKFGYKSVMQVPKLDKIVINVGAGEAKDNAKVIDSISADIAEDHWSEARCLQGEEVRCELQAARGHADRREGYAARRPDVGVPMDRLFNVALPRV